MHELSCSLSVLRDSEELLDLDYHKEQGVELLVRQWWKAAPRLMQLHELKRHGDTVAVVALVFD